MRRLLELTTLALPNGEVIDQEAVVSRARNLNNGVKLAIVTDQADFHHAVRQQLCLDHLVPVLLRCFFGHYTMNLRHSATMRFWRHAGVICALAGCSQVPPRTYPSPEPAQIAASFERTWSAVIDHFAEKSVPIRTIEKASGIIVAEQLSVSSGYGQVIADCGVNVVGVPWDVLSASYNVRVQGDSTKSTIRVTAMFRPEIASTYPCNSRGAYERELMDFVKARAEKR